MSKNMRTDTFFYVDLEALCWSDEDIANGNFGFPEIAEIGVYECDLEFNPLRKKSIILKTSQEPSRFFTELTGITPKMIRNGVTWERAYKQMVDIGSKNKVFITWGADQVMMKRHCENYQVNNPLSDYHLDLGVMYTMMFNGGKRTGLYRTLEKFGISTDGTVHRASDDAENLSRLHHYLHTRFHLGMKHQETINEIPCPLVF